MHIGMNERTWRDLVDRAALHTCLERLIKKAIEDQGNDSGSAEIERLRKLIDSQELIALCPKCNTTYIDHDGFGCCGCDDPEAKQLRVPPVPSITYGDGRIKSACLHGWRITARHHKGETWVDIKPAAQEVSDGE